MTTQKQIPIEGAFERVQEPSADNHAREVGDRILDDLERRGL